MLLPMRLKSRQDIVDGEASRVGIGQDAGNKSSEATLVLPWRVCLRRSGADERSDAAACLDYAGAFEFRVHAGNRVGVDLEVDRQLPDGRELIARSEPASGNRRPEPALELRVDRRPVARVYGDDVHKIYCTSILVQSRQAKSGPAGSS